MRITHILAGWSTVLLAAATAPAASVADLSGLALQNVSDRTGTFVETGKLVYDIDVFAAPPGSLAYMNLVIDLNGDGFVQVSTNGCNEWLIDDSPLRLDDAALSYNHAGYFALPAPLVGSAVVYVVVSDVEEDVADGTPVGSLTWPSYVVPVSTFRYLFTRGQASPPLPPAPAAPAEVDLRSGAADASSRDGMRDIPQKHNECGPTSSANSLIWLAEKHKWVDKLRKAAGLKKGDSITKGEGGASADEDEIVKGLRDKMVPKARQKRPFGGLNDDELADGKKKLANDNGLPIEVHGGMNDPAANGANAWDFIQKELAKGQDVEFLVGWKGGGSHWVTAVGTSNDKDKKKLGVKVVDPDDKSGDSKKPTQVDWEFDKNGKMTKGPEVGAKAMWAVAESPICPDAAYGEYHSTQTTPGTWTESGGILADLYKDPVWINDTTLEIDNVKVDIEYKTVYIFVAYKTAKDPANPPAIGIATASGQAPRETKREWSAQNKHLHMVFVLPDQPAWERITFPNNSYKTMSDVERMDVATDCQFKPDCNYNIVPDWQDISQGASFDENTNGVPDECDLADCNGNLQPDVADIATGGSADCDADGRPDECSAPGLLDCDADGAVDSCAVESGHAPDCNLNRVPDACDIAANPGLDGNLDGIPDTCQDCNLNGILDPEEILLHGAPDCNGNGIPDPCDMDPSLPLTSDWPAYVTRQGGGSSDQNENLIPDDCEFGAAGLDDCNTNGIIDGVDLQFGLSVDLGGSGLGGLQPAPNGVPDECDPDCNHNGLPDFRDAQLGTSADFRDNVTGAYGPDGVLDECCVCGPSADADGDSDADLADFARLAQCFGSYPGSTPSMPPQALQCGCFDLDASGAIDLADFEVFEGALYGPEDLGSFYPATCGFSEYHNETAVIEYYFPQGSGFGIGDDLRLAAPGTGALSSVDLLVYGGGGEGGPFNVMAMLFDSCPGTGGMPLPGAQFTWSGVPDDEYLWLLSAESPPGSPIIVPPGGQLYMVVQFSTPQAGWVMAGPAETGYTADLFGLAQPSWQCNLTWGGNPYAGFWANVTTTATYGPGLRAAEPGPSLRRYSLQPAAGLRPVVAESHGMEARPSSAR